MFFKHFAQFCIIFLRLHHFSGPTILCIVHNFSKLQAHINQFTSNLHNCFFFFFVFTVSIILRNEVVFEHNLDWKKKGPTMFNYSLHKNAGSGKLSRVGQIHNFTHYVRLLQNLLVI